MMIRGNNIRVSKPLSVRNSPVQRPTAIQRPARHSSTKVGFSEPADNKPKDVSQAPFTNANEVQRAHRSKLTTIFQNKWKNPKEPLITSRQQVDTLLKQASVPGGDPQMLFDYWVGQGQVEPAVVKAGFEDDLKKVQQMTPSQKQSLKNLLRQRGEQLAHKHGWRYNNPQLVQKVFEDHFLAEAEALIDGKEANFHLGSWTTMKTQVKFEYLMEHSPLWSHFTPEQQLELADKLTWSNGYMTLEHTQPQPPPSHSWVEPVAIKRLAKPLSEAEVGEAASRITAQAQQLLSATSPSSSH